MISESNNGSTNTLIDVLGMDTINEFIREHGFEASLLQRKMLEKNGKENYTSTGDCGRVLREVYEGTYVSQEASARIMEAMRAQIARNRYKIPAGVPEGIETANKTGELFTTDENGVNVTIQNDAAIIFVDNHPYVLTVMTAVPSAGEGEMHSQIAALSSEVYEAVIIETPGEENTEDAEENTGSAAGTDEQDASSGETGSETGGTIEEAPAAEGDTESVSEDAPVSLPEPAEK
jgi:beta-lactamase class A